MSEPTKTSWRIAGEEVVSCNCSWGCPCQFNALPTTGHCEAAGVWQISDGYFRNTRLDGVRFARLYWWPGAIHEGNGVRHTIIDEEASKEQREALIALDSGEHGGTYWEIFAAVCPNLIEPLFAPVSLNVDRGIRTVACLFSRYRRVRYRADQKPCDRRGTQGAHFITQWLRIHRGRDG
jgi:hypothetical protein